jgi:HD-GYP domain-containing protein (c-di-GMP phosphodiesterase class II)
MKKIIIFEPDIMLNDIYRSLVDSTVQNFEIIFFYEASELFEYLEVEPEDIVLAIFAHNPQGQTAFKICRDLSISGLPIPTIIIAEASKVTEQEKLEFLQRHVKNKILYDKHDSEALSYAITSSLIEDEKIPHTIMPPADYVAITPLLLLYSSTTRCDIYLKDNLGKYHLLYRENVEVSEKQIQELNDSVEKFYIRQDSKNDFYDFYLSLLETKNFSYNVEHEKDDFKLQQQLLSMAMDQMQNVGVDEKLLNIVTKNIAANLVIINKTKNLKSLLTQIIKKEDESFEHAMTTDFIAQLMLKKTDWKSPLIQYKISLASFFHDIYQSKIDSDVELKFRQKKITLNQLLCDYPNVYGHASKAAELIESLPNIPPDTAHVIENHHELPGGAGFPKKLFGNAMAPLCCLFNIAHYFSQEVSLLGWSKDNVKSVIEQMDLIFYEGNYSKPFAHLKELFK